MTEEEYIDKMIENIFATEHLKEYKREYYEQHKDRYNQYYLKWCRDNPKKKQKLFGTAGSQKIRTIRVTTNESVKQ